VIIGAASTSIDRDDYFDIQMDKYDGQALQLFKVGNHFAPEDGLRLAISSDTDRRKSASYMPPYVALLYCFRVPSR
jgi:hypothetical protein